MVWYGLRCTWLCSCWNDLATMNMLKYQAYWKKSKKRFLEGLILWHHLKHLKQTFTPMFSWLIKLVKFPFDLSILFWESWWSFLLPFSFQIDPKSPESLAIQSLLHPGYRISFKTIIPSLILETEASDSKQIGHFHKHPTGVFTKIFLNQRHTDSGVRFLCRRN